MGEEIEVLEYKAHLDAQFFQLLLVLGVEIQAFAVDPYLAFLWVLQTGNTPQQGGFTRTGRADQTDDLPFFHFQAGVIHRLEGSEALGNMFKTNH